MAHKSAEHQKNDMKEERNQEKIKGKLKNEKKSKISEISFTLMYERDGRVKSQYKNRVKTHSGMVECKLENCSDAFFVRSIVPE